MSRNMCERKSRRPAMGVAALLAVVASVSTVYAQPQWLRDDKVMPQNRGGQGRGAAPAPAARSAPTPAARPAPVSGRTVDIAASRPRAVAPAITAAPRAVAPAGPAI